MKSERKGGIGAVRSRANTTRENEKETMTEQEIQLSRLFFLSIQVCFCIIYDNYVCTFTCMY